MVFLLLLLIILGCLMRVSPLGIYTAIKNSSKEEVFDLARKDA